MNEATHVVQYILNFGSSVVLPLIIFILGLIVRQPVGKAFRSALTIGIGLTGVTLVVNLLTGDLGPAAEAMVKATGIHLQVIDVGWPTMAAMSWAWIGAAMVFPIGIVLNIVMLWRGWTRTMDVDLWNYWHWVFNGACVYFLTGNIFLGWLAALFTGIVVFKYGDYTQPWVEKYFNLPGISFPHSAAVGWMPLFLPIIGLLNRFKWWRSLPKITPESVQKRFGVLGQPMVWGLVLGIVLGLLGRQSPAQILQLGMAMAAVMLLLPRMVSILMEGLIPISESAREFLQKRYPNRKDIYIGMDAALAIGHPAVISTGLLLVPITLGLAFVLPGNHVLPFVDLAVWPFLLCMVVAMNQGDILRSTILGAIMSVGVLYSANILWPLQTALAKASGIKLPGLAAGHIGITNLDRQLFMNDGIINVFSFFNHSVPLWQDLIWLVVFLFLVASVLWISPKMLRAMWKTESRTGTETSSK